MVWGCELHLKFCGVGEDDEDIYRGGSRNLWFDIMGDRSFTYLHTGKPSLFNAYTGKRWAYNLLVLYVR